MLASRDCSGGFWNVVDWGLDEELERVIEES